MPINPFNSGGGVSLASGGTITGNLVITGTLDVTGVATFTTTVTGSGNIMAGAAFAVGFTGRSQFKSSADGVMSVFATNGSTLSRLAVGAGSSGSDTLGLTLGAANYGFWQKSNFLVVELPGVASSDLCAFGYDGGTAFGLIFRSNSGVGWASSTDPTGTIDTGVYRVGAGIVGPGAGAAAPSAPTAGDWHSPKSVLTAGTMTVSSNALVRKVIHKFSWTNAMVTALGAALTGDITVCTLPAKFVVTNAYVVILTAAGGVTTLTVAVGRTSAAYIDYIVASDAKAAANTVYGDASAERGTNLTGYDLPSFTGTTAVNAHFISTGTNLNTVTTSTGEVHIEGYLLS